MTNASKAPNTRKSPAGAAVVPLHLRDDQNGDRYFTVTVR